MTATSTEHRTFTTKSRHAWVVIAGLLIAGASPAACGPEGGTMDAGGDAVTDADSPAAKPDAGASPDKVRQIGGGLNPAGYPDEYIAFTYNPALGATSNNYRELMKDFTGTWLLNAQATSTAAQSVERDFESSYQAVAQQMVATNADYGKRIADL